MTTRDLALWLAVLALGCGGKVTFQAGEPEGGGGGGPAPECVAGACGERCNKCSGSDCFNGVCDEDGVCVDEDEGVVCDE